MTKSMSAPTGTGALTGIRVLDLTRVLGGPYATQILGDHGADVVKVEPPSGDEVRGWGPPFHEQTAGYFIGVNRNKRSLVLDLSTAQGREVLLRLLERSDVMIENFKPGTLEKWGLGYADTLQHRFPSLVCCRISGFGSDGPRGGLPGYDAIIQCLSGMMEANGSQESGPLRVGVPIVDITTGLYAAIGILMALAERTKSGRGQFLEVPLYDAALSAMHPHAANYFLSGRSPKLTGNAHPNISPYDTYRTATAPIFLGIGNDPAFARLSEQLGAAELAIDERFRTNAARVTNRDALKAELEAHLSRHDGPSFAERLLAAGLPAGAIRSLADALDDPQARHRQVVVERDWYCGVASPIRLSRSKASLRHLPPDLGQDGRAILLEAGFSADEVVTLAESEIIGAGQ